MHLLYALSKWFQAPSRLWGRDSHTDIPGPLSDRWVVCTDNGEGTSQESLHLLSPVSSIVIV